MLNPSEKAYTLALQALKRKDYRAAAGYFDSAAPDLGKDMEFSLLRQTTQLLIDVRKMLAGFDDADSRLEIEEVFSDGQEKDVP